MFTRLFAVILLVAASLNCTPAQSQAIARALPVITDVIVKILDAQHILDKVDNAAKIFFADNPSTTPAQKAKYDQAVDAAKATLNFALRATAGAKDLTEEQDDNAFANFRAAYKELTVVITDIGLLQGDKLGTNKNAPHTLTVETPLALSPKAKQWPNY